MMHELIRASAGTGKTHALARRLIDLLSLPGEAPKASEIVALTFSRAAAGEIFERFLKMLAADANANPSSDAANIIREVIASQHLSQIGTLDSFLMRMVRSFPLEVGLKGDIEVMNDFESSAARSRASFEILRRTDSASKKAFVDAFNLVMDRERVRSFIETYREFVKFWHETYLSNPDKKCWGDPSTILSPSCAIKVADVEDLAAAADALKGLVDSPAWEEFIEWVRSFRGSVAGVKGFAKKFLESENLFSGSVVEISFNRRTYTFGGSDAAAVRKAIAAVVGYILRMKIEMASGIYTLVKAFEDLYAAKVRSTGKLVFSDVPRLVSSLDPASRAGLEYRLDSRIRAWALDEFQDTSREQWKAIYPLIEEAKSSEEKSVFIVGDVKQAIYGWRNGDVGILEAERKSGFYSERELNHSWRSGEPIIEAVNAVFNGGRLHEEFPEWESAFHATAKKDLGGFVQVVEAPGRKKEDFAIPVANALKAVDPVSKGISAAVLVRNNDFGVALAEDLRKAGIENVVWEGESHVLDTSALSPFLDIVSLADHPGDSRAYSHFIRSPLAKALYPESIPEAGELSATFSRAFAERGMVRVFREMRAALPADPSAAWSTFTESRFTDLLRAAADFELARRPDTRLADFSSFLSSCSKRNIAEPGKIKVLSIHRSKGLAFDYVILPLYEHHALDARPEGPLKGDGWILPDPGAVVEHFASEISPSFASAVSARRARSEQEELCIYYVAMTRARKAMTIVTQPPAKNSQGVRFSDFVRSAIPDPIGNSAWHLESAQEKKKDKGADSCRHSPPPRMPRVKVKRRLPSLSFVSGQSAGDLFLADNARKEAMERGVKIHSEYEKVEWIDAAHATDDFDRALVRPEDAVCLWREKAFEIFADGEWTSGRFDRVVFLERGGTRHAVVQDFKTDRKRKDESDAHFAERLRREYASQMEAYRKAVSRLTKISEDLVSSEILVVSNRTVVKFD
jgi:ATP-dependent exoDNAse (exonuclease V) beta subunit